MNHIVNPIQASRELLSVLASHNSTTFEQMLCSDASMQIWSDHSHKTYCTSSNVQQALLKEAETWPNPTINIKEWDGDGASATVQFQIWIKKNGQYISHDRSLTVTLRDDQIEMISLYLTEDTLPN